MERFLSTTVLYSTILLYGTVLIRHSFQFIVSSALCARNEKETTRQHDSTTAITTSSLKIETRLS